MTQVERVARELHEVDRAEAATLGGRCTDQQHWREFLALARHVLRRERAAMRRATKCRKAILEHIVRVTTERSTKRCVCRSCLTHVNHFARVVAVPKRRKGAKR